MACSLSNIQIWFVKSDIRIRPFSIDIRRSRHDSNTFDHVSCEITTEAGELITDTAISREPVVIEKDNVSVYRGYYKHDSVGHGISKDTLQIQDPRRIMKAGIIDKEWGEITLNKVTQYIYERIQDPEGVIKRIELASPEVNTEKAQHTSFFGIDRRDASSRTSVSNVLVDAINKSLPLLEGDGNFDFRQESPYSALREVVNLWETDFWIDTDGVLKIGPQEAEVDVYSAGRGSGNMFISEWDLPPNPTPLKAVVVKGKADYPEEENTWIDIFDREKFETRAAAGFLNNSDLSEIMVVESKKETSDPESLKRMASGRFVKEYRKNNRGSVTINALAGAEDVSGSDYASMDIGDKLVVNNKGSDCDKMASGIYDIHEVNHSISGGSGWSISFQVTAEIIDGGFTSKFWYFDPTDPKMAEDNLEGEIDI